MVWIVKKGISCFLILLGVTFVTFALMYLAGGDAISYFYEIRERQFLKRSWML